MLRAAAEGGTTDIVATPHANSQYTFDEGRVQKIFSEITEASAGFIRLHLGCDFHLSYENLIQAMQNPSKFTINGRRYLMVELPDVAPLGTVRTGLRQLLNARIVPIITHPERNESVAQERREMQAWRATGCLLQITGQSLLGGFGPAAQAAAEQLLGAGMVDFVASDAHDLVHRPTDLSATYKFIEARYGSEMADRVLVENPTAVIWGEPIAATKKPPKRRLFGLFG